MSMLEYFDGAQQGRRMDGRPEESRDDCRWRSDWNVSHENLVEIWLDFSHLEEWVVIEWVISWRAATPAVGSVKLLRLEDEGETFQFPAKMNIGPSSFELGKLVWALPDVHFHWSGAAFTGALCCSSCLPLLSCGQWKCASHLLDQILEFLFWDVNVKLAATSCIRFVEFWLHHLQYGLQVWRLGRNWIVWRCKCNELAATSWIRFCIATFVWLFLNVCFLFLNVNQPTISWTSCFNFKSCSFWMNLNNMFEHSLPVGNNRDWCWIGSQLNCS